MGLLRAERAKQLRSRRRALARRRGRPTCIRQLKGAGECAQTGADRGCDEAARPQPRAAVVDKHDDEAIRRRELLGKLVHKPRRAERLRVRTRQRKER